MFNYSFSLRSCECQGLNLVTWQSMKSRSTNISLIGRIEIKQAEYLNKNNKAIAVNN